MSTLPQKPKNQGQLCLGPLRVKITSALDSSESKLTLTWAPQSQVNSALDRSESKLTLTWAPQSQVDPALDSSESKSNPEVKKILSNCIKVIKFARKN